MLLAVDVTEKIEANHILVALHENLETFGPAVEGASVGWRPVPNQNRLLSVELHSGKSELEPLEYIAWVIAFRHQVVVEDVRRHCVNSNHHCVGVNGTIRSAESLRVKAVHGEFFESFRREPRRPQISQYRQDGVFL